jgi:hypothetical protein
MPNPTHQSNNTEITALPATAPMEEIVNVIKRDGGIIIKNFVTHEENDRMDKESRPTIKLNSSWKPIDRSD